ncbi:MAG TPA: ABC transporter substrate-binding protein [Candidatus Thermoplasmatota archaeon]|nr:ABC transporter substrate-binding protein [Candidatus Thermoplasmatota archaeon]
MTHRMLLLAAISLVAAPVLAGCADNADNPGTGTTPTRTTNQPTGATPTATPTSGTPTIPTNVAPITPPLTLKLGLMNPLSGDLSNLGPSMQKGMELAVEEINAVSALTGLTIQVVGREDDTTGDQTRATAAYDRLVGLGATAIAGPCCSGVTGAILTRAVEDGVIVASPSATSPTLTETDRQGLFWRVSPTDAGQGRVLAEMVKADGHTSVNMIVVNNDYGNGFAGVFEEVFEAAGGNVGTISRVDETAATVVSSQVTQACSGNPNAVVMVVYTDTGAEVLRAMQAQGCLARVQVYASEGIFSPVLAGSVVEQAGRDPQGRWLAQGMKGTTPQAINTTVFSQAYQAKFNEAPQQYAPESYDAVMYIALGALAAKSVNGEDIAAKMLDNANPGGAQCRAFRDCALFLLAGQDIDYQGYAHDLEFHDNNGSHEPRSGAYSYWEVNAEGQMALTRENVVPSE